MPYLFQEDTFMLHDKEEHQNLLQDVNANPKLSRNFKSPENAYSTNCHNYITENLAPNIMHDIPGYKVKWIWNSLIFEKQLFDVNTLNGRVQGFNHDS